MNGGRENRGGKRRRCCWGGLLPNSNQHNHVDYAYSSRAGMWLSRSQCGTRQRNPNNSKRKKKYIKKRKGWVKWNNCLNVNDRNGPRRCLYCEVYRGWAETSCLDPDSEGMFWLLHGRIVELFGLAAHVLTDWIMAVDSYLKIDPTIWYYPTYFVPALSRIGCPLKEALMDRSS